ncbi:DUF4426 domain-containing protein [Pseudomonas sp. 7P_10.2_Bac1]|uniref:DUF4426 domain-containing protein n=1 Tax=Pseudomonas sp. 7P_10.2_Bac1 TaxID=2971614 RepID=UPI0021C69F3C|nr:DUF4426 domain-containing protein [Pseudomonas sp. 7P_10.2_Bac1]MCU1728243.1 DUF4426 domain-containing protein [Pseudomonas sp. 7P_10.2_Bac1]
MGRIALILLSMCFAVQAIAAGTTQVGDTVVNYNAFMTNFLSPDITTRYGLQRSDQLGALNVNLSRADQKIASTIKGTYHLNGEKKPRPLTFRQVINDQGAIDYFAQFPVQPAKVYVFNIELKINGESKAIEFSQEVASLQ